MVGPAMQKTTLQQSFSVNLAYPVVFTRGVFAGGDESLRGILGDAARCLVVLDRGVHAAFPDLRQRIEQWFGAEPGLKLAAPVELVEGGEAIKNDYRQVMSLVDLMLEHGLCRHSYVIAIGGGAMLDAVGFATGLVHRGLRLIRMPSTTLAQDDAGVGVKNGMNLHGGKNTVGMFAAPYAVVNDLDFLAGQTDEHWIGGVSEAFKVALIKDAAFFDELCENSAALGARDPEAMERVVIRCAALHLEHIATNGDPFELGSARPLDFGHWSAHQLERMSQFRISHGHAVAIGVALDSAYAVAAGWLEETDFGRLIEALQQCGFRLHVPELEQRLGDGRRAVFLGLDAFQEHLGGDLCLAMPDGVGRLRDLGEVDEACFDRCIDRLRALSKVSSV